MVINNMNYEIDNKNQKDKDMMVCKTDEEFVHWLMNDARKYGVKGRKYR